MKWLKIGALLLVTLAAMRAVSWALAWALARFSSLRPRAIAVLSNLGGFGLFLLLLLWNLMPGESMDRSAILFGIAVFLIFAFVDLYWVPWRTSKQRQDRSQSAGAE
jgi:hypothetical protein